MIRTMYSTAAAFARERDAKLAYQFVWGYLRARKAQASTLRFWSDPWHIVAVIGEEPREEVWDGVERHLTERGGRVFELPDAAHEELGQMRARGVRDGLIVTTPIPPHSHHHDIIPSEG